MRRVTELDSLRGLAALTIIFYHLWFMHVPQLGTAVDLFFVLSGFLITTIILDNAATEGFLVTFYVRRSLRIWPIYYLSLLALVVLNPFLPTPEPMDGLPYYLTYTQMLPLYWSGVEPPFSRAFEHTWTLAIEEQFYLLWPALVCLLGRRRLIPLALALVVSAVWARYQGMNPLLLITHCDGLALGGLLALLLNDRERVARRSKWLTLGFIALGLTALSFPAWDRRLIARLSGIVSIPASEHHLALHSLRRLWVNLGFLSMVGVCIVNAGRPALGWLRDRRLAYLGQISYGLYLYHLIVFRISDNLARAHGFGETIGLDAIKLALMFALAALSWSFIERPILALKDRFDYRRKISAYVGVPASAGLRIMDKLKSG
jgi:peptidoglycan/LPS O-acetylase OafA/YrhL